MKEKSKKKQMTHAKCYSDIIQQLINLLSQWFINILP